MIKTRINWDYRSVFRKNCICQISRIC